MAFHPSFFALIKDLTSIISLQGGCAFGLIPRCCGVPHNAIACDTSNFSFFVDFKWDLIFFKIDCGTAKMAYFQSFLSSPLVKMVNQTEKNQPNPDLPEKDEVELPLNTHNQTMIFVSENGFIRSRI